LDRSGDQDEEGEECGSERKNEGRGRRQGGTAETNKTGTRNRNLIKRKDVNAGHLSDKGDTAVINTAISIRVQPCYISASSS